MYGLKGTGDMAGNPKYEMLTSYPGLESIYSLVAGFLYILPNSLGGMSLNLIKPGYNRTLLMTLMVGLAGSTALGQGTVDSLNVFILMRVVHALVNSVINPLIFGTVSDYFPPD